MTDVILTPQQQSNLVSESASLVDLRLRDISSRLGMPSPRTPLSLAWSVHPTMVRFDVHSVLYHVTYELVATSPDSREAFRANLTMSVLLSVDHAGLNEEQLKSFGRIGIMDIVHPYVREIVHSLTGRMGLPPLVLEIKARSADLGDEAGGGSVNAGAGQS